jgi:hypothetical protein
VNDGHDTTVDFIASWLEFWFIPLLQDTRFNDNKTLILLTFDENETAGINNRIWAALLGGAVPANLTGTTDSTYYTHYSSMSTVQANWRLGTLGRGDTNPWVTLAPSSQSNFTYPFLRSMSNVYSFVASATGYTNNALSGASIPLTNASGTYPGPLNANMYVPFVAPNVSAVGAGGGPVFVASNLNKSLTSENAPAPVNLTAANKTVPASGPISPSPSATPTSKSGARRDVVLGGATAVAVLGAMVGSAALFM